MSRGRIRRRAATVVVLAATFVVGAATAAHASIGGFSANDGTEGNPSACATTLDWSCLSASQLVTTLDPSGSSDLAFVGTGNNESDPGSWQIAPGSVTDGKAEIAANWSHAYTDSSFTSNYLAVAFERGAGNGNSAVDFELNQKAPGTTSTYVNSKGTTVFCRTDGDVLIAFNVQSTAALNQTTPTVYKWTWTSGTPCTVGAIGTWGKALANVPAEGAVRNSPVTNYLSTSSLGSSFAAGTFGEAAVNLTGLASAINPAAGCEFFNHMQLTTSSSTSTGADMEDFVDEGGIVAPACASSGTGSGCTAAPSVQITSPANDTTDTTSTVTLSGTSSVLNGHISVFDGTTAVGTPATNGSGAWTLTLTGVSDGTHTYKATATNACGTTPSSSVAVIVNTSGSGSGTGSGSGSGSGSGTGSGSGSGAGSGTGTGTGSVLGSSVSGAWLACTSPRVLALADVYAWAGRARLTGFAPRGSAGKIVTILAAWNHKVLGHARVLGDSSFRATVQLPPKSLRATARGAYLAQLGVKRSAPLAFTRRMYNTRIQIRFVREKVTTIKFRMVNGKRKRVKVTKFISAHTITFVGTVVGPFANPRQSVVIRGAHNCAGVAHGRVLARAKVNSRGRFSVTFTLPSSLARFPAIFLRAQTVALKSAPHRKAGTSRPTRVSLFGITRGVHVF